MQVYKAQYLHCDVAVKKLNRTNDKRSDDAFRREAGLLKGCRNPYIVNFMGVCKDEVQHPSLFQPQSLPVPESSLKPFESERDGQVGHGCHGDMQHTGNSRCNSLVSPSHCIAGMTNQHRAWGCDA